MSRSKTPNTSKLINLVNSLNLKEKRDLEKFLLLSSFGLTNRDRDLFNRLLKMLEIHKEIDEEKFWKSALSEKEYLNKNRIKSRLYKAIENFTCFLEINKNDGIKIYLLTLFYSRKNLAPNLLQTINKGIRKLSILKEHIFDDKIILYWLQEKMVLINKDLRKEKIHINDMENELTEFYAINKLRIICEKVNLIEILNSGNEASSYHDEVEYLKNCSNSIYVKIFYHLYLLLGLENESSFEIVNTELKKIDLVKNSSIAKEAYIHLMNYCIRKINARKLEYAEPFFNYVKFLDINKILLDNNTISIGRFKNIMVICYILDKLDWATSFIEKYSGHLQEIKNVQREEFLSLNKAIIALWCKEYDRCIDLIHKFQSSKMYHKDMYYKITCDKLLLKVYFEKDEFEALDNKIAVLIGYIRNRETLNEKRKTPNLKFLTVLDKINRKKNVDIIIEKHNIPMADYIWLERVTNKG